MWHSNITFNKLYLITFDHLQRSYKCTIFIRFIVIFVHLRRQVCVRLMFVFIWLMDFEFETLVYKGVRKIGCNKSSFNREHHSIQSLSILDVSYFLQIPIEWQLISANSITPLLFSIEFEYKWRKECYSDDFFYCYCWWWWCCCCIPLLKCHYVNVCILNEMKIIDGEYLFERSDSCKVQGSNMLDGHHLERQHASARIEHNRSVRLDSSELYSLVMDYLLQLTTIQVTDQNHKH